MMRPPKRDDAADPGQARHRHTSENVTGEATRKVYADSRPFLLTIRAGDRRTVWGSYPSRAASEELGRRLRAHGIDARTSDEREATP